MINVERHKEFKGNRGGHEFKFNDYIFFNRGHDIGSPESNIIS